MKELRQIYVDQCKKNIKRHFVLVAMAITMLSLLGLVSGNSSKKFKNK